ncbi:MULTISPECIES: RNA polymerase-binding protein DksA [Ramlibacter]|uniref:RNA polymerase-binding protein DksA n=1 Tax=Ramlibacter TaxID=174951 RepID=UPI00257C0A2A|nr:MULTISPECIES: RNA polymerase-binding protein DksA [Ramlibacter]
MKAQPKAAAKAGAKTAQAKTPARKAPAKPAAKPVAKKAAAKAPAPAAKKATTAKKAAAPAKKAAASAKKPAAAVKKAPVPAKKAAPAKAVKLAKAPSAAKPVTAPAAKAPTPSAVPPVPPAAPVAGATPPRPHAEPVRATKPSARLASVTVPSIAANTVASTAAKASYNQTMPSPLLTPPPLVAIKKDPKLANNWKAKAADELTDAEVLAMPDSEYMNDKQLAFFRLKLVQLKQDILNSAGETTEHLREDTVIVPDPADRATIEEEHALELRTRDRERKLLKKIEQSIARIDAGDYGYCDETGEPIGVGRLLARPTATLSLEAQQRRELKQKMFGD